MKRRTLLRTVGAAVGAGTVAGCLADDEAAPGGSGSDPETTDTTAPTTEPNGEDPTTRGPDDGSTTEPGRSTTPDEAVFGTDADDPFESITVGSREGVENPDDNRPHGVNVWNAAEEDRTLTIAVQRGSATVLEETITFPGDGYLSMTLAEPGDYRVPILEAGEELGVVTVDRGRFDCNSSATNVDVTPGGEIRATVISTMVACDATEISDPTFESAEGTCTSGAPGDGERASVTFDDGVSIEGAILAPNPCHRATLVDVAETDDSLTVTVGIEDAREAGTACVECVGSVGYTLGFDPGIALPERVTVVHRNHQGETTVATAER